MSIGERISILRKEKNISQNQLAQLLSVSRQAVSKWENDQATPDALNLIRLSEFLETDIEYLTTGRQVLPTRPPVVVKSVETVEKVVEKIVEKEVRVPVEKIVKVPVIEYVDRPVIRNKTRTKFIRNPLEFFVVGLLCFVIGFLIGKMI